MWLNFGGSNQTKPNSNHKIMVLHDLLYNNLHPINSAKSSSKSDVMLLPLTPSMHLYLHFITTAGYSTLGFVVSSKGIQN